MQRSNGVAEGVSPLLSQSAPTPTPFPQPSGKNAHGKGFGKGNSKASTKASGKGGKHNTKGISDGVGGSKGEHGVGGGARPRSASAAASWLLGSMKHRRSLEHGAELDRNATNAAGAAGAGSGGGVPAPSPLTVPKSTLEVRSARSATTPADFANLHLSVDYSAEDKIIGSPADHVDYNSQSLSNNRGIGGSQPAAEGDFGDVRHIDNPRAASHHESPDSSIPLSLNQDHGLDARPEITRRRTDPGQAHQQPSSWPVLNRMRPPALNLPSFFGPHSQRSRSKSNLSPRSSGEKHKKKQNRSRAATMGGPATDSGGRNLSAGSTGSGDGDSPALARQVAEWVLGGPSPRSSAEPASPPPGNQFGSGPGPLSAGGAAPEAAPMTNVLNGADEQVAMQQGIAATMLLSAAMGGESESIFDDSNSVSGRRHASTHDASTFGLDEVYGSNHHSHPGASTTSAEPISPKAAHQGRRHHAWTPSALIGRLRSASHSGRFDKSGARGSNSSSGSRSTSRTSSRSTSGASFSSSPHSSVDSRQSSTSEQFSSGRVGRSFSSPVTVDDKGSHPRPRGKPLSFLKLLRRGSGNSHSSSSHSSGGGNASPSSKKGARVNSNSSDIILNGGQRVITSLDKNGRDASYGSSIATDSRGSDLRAFYESHRELDSFSSYPVPTPLEEDELFDADFLGRRQGDDDDDDDDDDLGLPPYNSAWATEPPSPTPAPTAVQAGEHYGSPTPSTGVIPAGGSDAGAAASTGGGDSSASDAANSFSATTPSQVPAALAPSSVDDEGWRAV